MTEEQRLLIVKTRLGETKKHEPVAELFVDNPKLEFPELRLFDLPMLDMVGIDPNALTGEFVYKRYWAYYAESDKVNKNGVRYRDVQYLEPIGSKPADTADTAGNDALLDALRKVYKKITDVEEILTGEIALLSDRIATLERSLDLALFHGPVEAPAPPQPETGTEPPPAQAEPKHVMPQPEKMTDPVLDEEQSMRKFYLLVGPAMKHLPTGYVKNWQAQVGAKAKSWRDALADLEEKSQAV